MEKSDIIIIGSGPGGYRSALYAASKELNVVIVESDEIGGTCLNNGCIPTKTLCRNAEVVDTLGQSGVYGLEISNSGNLNFQEVQERKRQIVGQLRDGVASLMSSSKYIKLVKGTAHFIDNKSIAVGDNVFTADNIIVATGSSSKCPPIEGTTLTGVVNSTELLNIDSVPKRLCIIGAGVIGMEFASIFSSFGSKVSVIEFLKECLPVVDSDIAKRLRQRIAKRGVDFYMQSAVSLIKETTDDKGNRQLSVEYERKGKCAQIDADIVLIATGRKPNIDGLDLNKAGVDYTPKGIVVNKDFQTNIDGIYAIGDVNGQCMLAHAATFQGFHAINHILGKEDNIRFDIMPSAVFTNPEAACVGFSEDSLKEKGCEYECRKGFYRSNGKALAMGESEGMIKVLVDKANGNRIVGCHAYGAHASDIVQEVASLMNKDIKLNELADIIHIHPTLSEVLHETCLV